ncbi:CPBP family intramembrane metalloprotease [Oceanirhabdus sp. W0125-5]|nr:CPBP family intramembrane glutamic endopeptidase [Oceanirhabdus sp. W0125-5]WBW99799.1 CPBP family intramembrane metalloprotease [Oceanirhabdus sp. W0125-5]
MFALFHLGALLYGANIVDTLIQVMFAFGFGLIMAVVRYETDLMLPCILVHALWDFTLFITEPSESEVINSILRIRIGIVILLGIYLTFRVGEKSNKNYEIN